MSPYYYQVSIWLDPEILTDYKAWLKVHIDEMLALGLFQDAKTFESKSMGDLQGQYGLTVFYAYSQQENLQTYLDEYAPKMRSSLPEKFQGRLKFERHQLSEVNFD